MTKFIRRRKQASGDTDERDRRRAALFKLGALLVFSVIVIVIGSIAWFSSNHSVTENGMGAKIQPVPYIIETRDSSGYYKNIYDQLNSDAAEWKISASHNFDNHTSAQTNEEDEPALEPGDRGTLEFRVSPISADTMTVDCIFDIKAYWAEETDDGNGGTTTTLTEVNETALVNFLNAHIMLFTGIDEHGKYTGLIDNNNASLARILHDQVYNKGESTYTTIYWCWPEHLSELTNASNIIYAASEHENVMSYIAKNRTSFFKNCSESEANVKADLTGLYNSFSNRVYNRYNLQYDNADLDIGNNISYIVLSMQVE